MSFLERLRAPSTLKKHYDVVVVLTGMAELTQSDDSNVEFGAAVDRILKGIDLIKTNTADFLLISGGDGALISTGKSEAEILKRFAVRAGILEEKIIIDPISVNTYQNAVETMKLLESRNLKSVLLVTSAFHMFRADGCFKKQGIIADLLPVDFYSHSSVYKDFRDFLPSSQSLAIFNRFLHELVGITVYFLTGKASFF